jgi:hypothetical protein
MRKLLGIHAVSPHSPLIFSSAIFVHKFSVTQLADAQKGYNAYGPIPRLCIEFTLFPTLLSSYDTSRQATISDLSVDQLVEGAIQTSVLRSDAFHSIFVIRRQDDDMLMKFTVEPITHSIRQQLKKRFIQEGWEGQYRAYQHFDVMRLSDFADLVFEVMAQLRFRGAIALSPVPVVKQRRTRRTKTALWVSRSGKRLASPISITSSSTIEYEWSTLSEFHSGIFYVPKLSD